MRTTVVIPPDLYAKLAALAARRGATDVSAFIVDLLERHLNASADVAPRSAAGERGAGRGSLASIGSIDDEDAVALRASIDDLRLRWRAASPPATF